MEYKIKQRWSPLRSGAACLAVSGVAVRWERERPLKSRDTGDHTHICFFFPHSVHTIKHTQTQQINPPIHFLNSTPPTAQVESCNWLTWVSLTWRCPLSEPHPEPVHTGKVEPVPRAASCLGRVRSAAPSPPPENCQTGRGWLWPAYCGRSPPRWAYVDPGEVRGEGRFTTWVCQGLWYESQLCLQLCHYDWVCVYVSAFDWVGVPVIMPLCDRTLGDSYPTHNF